MYLRRHWNDFLQNGSKDNYSSFHKTPLFFT
jgi:hypothetical protein